LFSVFGSYEKNHPWRKTTGDAIPPIMIEIWQHWPNSGTVGWIPTSFVGIWPMAEFR
jgi:hypothetical protein